MIPKAFVKVALVQKDQRLGNAAARAGQPREHFERTQRLRMLNIRMTKNINQIRNEQRKQGCRYTKQLSTISLSYIIY